MKIVIYGLCLTRDIARWAVDRRRYINNIKSKYDIDMKLFIDQDGSVTKPMLDLIGDDTEVIDIRKVSTPNIRKLPRFQQGLNIGYKGMCLFYSSEFVHYLQGYDYAIRLDADSMVCSELRIDEFIESNKVYGYVRDKYDAHRETCETLPDAIKRYVHTNDVKIQCKESSINCWNFYNNFNISKLSFWKSPEFNNFMNFIHTEDGIQKHRWGDSTIQANAVKMFCRPREIQKFEFAYEHRSHGYKNYEEVETSPGVKIKRIIKK